MISIGSEIAGSAVAGAIGLFAVGCFGVVAASGAGPALEKELDKIGTEIYERVLGSRERVRIGAAAAFALDKIRISLESGLSIRQDNFFEQENNYRSSAEEVIEGVYLKSKSAYEEKKSNIAGYSFQT